MAFSVALKMCATACCSCVCASGERFRGYNNICNCNCNTTSTQWWILFSLHVHSDHRFFLGYFSFVWRSFFALFDGTFPLGLSLDSFMFHMFLCDSYISPHHVCGHFRSWKKSERAKKNTNEIPLQWNIILHVNFWFKRNILFAI